MALLHNIIIRGLNSIYLQAPHVAPGDQYAFCQYILLWHRLVHSHHSGEEEMLFPAIEAAAGEQGLMEDNVAQHDSFLGGLETFTAYVEACVTGTESYDGRSIVKLIDGFSEPLITHLTDEVPTIEGLRRFGDRLDKLPELMTKQAQQTMVRREEPPRERGVLNMEQKEMGLLTGMPWCYANIDRHFENGTWFRWPDAPVILDVAIRYLSWWIHAGWWKFGACDRMGNMQPLYAVPADTGKGL